MFPEEVSGLHPKRDIDFPIKLDPVETPVSKAPYRMSMPKLMELKL